jgi:luciferase family oxidoreductase group 1
VQAVPGAGLNVPIWLLGSSLYSAQLAAALGLPFAFAAHFAPDHLLDALQVYRSTFQPSEALEQPYAMAAINVIAADSDDEAVRLATSVQQAFLNLQRGRPGPLPPPVDSMDALWTPAEAAGLRHLMRYGVVGGLERVQHGLDAFLELTGVDELMVTAQVFDHQARLRSFELVAEARTAIV